MKSVICLLSAVLCLLSGCATLPVIGPCSYIASESNKPVPGLAATQDTMWQTTWKAAKVTLGYAADTFIWAAAASAVADELNDGNDSEAIVIPPLGNGNVVINNQSGTVNYNSDSFNSGTE